MDQQAVDTVGDHLGYPPYLAGHDGQARAGCFHQRHGKAFVVGGEHEDVRSDQQTQDVVALAEELEPTVEPELAPSLLELVRHRTPTDGGEPQGRVVIGDQPGRLEQDVVALLLAEVGHRHHQQLVAGDAQLVAHLASNLVALRKQTVSAGEIHTVDDHPGTSFERAGQPFVNCRGHHDERLVERDGGPIESPGQDGHLVPGGMLGVDHRRSPVLRNGRHHQAAQCAGGGEVEVDDVELAVHDQPAESAHPDQVGVAGGPQRVHRGAVVPNGGHQSVLIGNHIGHLVVERPPVALGHHVDEQPLGAPVAEAFDHLEDAEVSGRNVDGSLARSLDANPSDHPAMLPFRLIDTAWGLLIVLLPEVPSKDVRLMEAGPPCWAEGGCDVRG